MNKVLKILGVVFFSVGILVIGIGIWEKISFRNFIKTAVETKATIVDISSNRDSDDNHNVTIEFMVDGKKYSGRLNYYSSTMYVGEQEIIYYNPENPNQFKTKDENLLSFIPLLIGGIFLLIGSSFLIIIIVKGKNRKRLLSYNYVIQANIIGFNMDTSMSVNGRCPYRLEANYINPTDGKLYSYRSDALWSDLTPILEQRQITTIPVYVDPNNFSKYYVDISSLQKFIGN